MDVTVLIENWINKYEQFVFKKNVADRDNILRIYTTRLRSLRNRNILKSKQLEIEDLVGNLQAIRQMSKLCIYSIELSAKEILVFTDQNGTVLGKITHLKSNE